MYSDQHEMGFLKPSQICSTPSGCRVIAVSFSSKNLYSEKRLILAVGSFEDVVRESSIFALQQHTFGQAVKKSDKF